MNTRGLRFVAAAGLAAAMVTGCAQPGQLGAAPAPAVAPPVPAPAPPAAPPLMASGRVEDRVSIRTPGPAVLSVRTVVLAPGEVIGWHRHPGTEMAVVRSGAVVVERADGCDPVRYAAGSALFVADAEPHRMRNDGRTPAELAVTQLLAPGTPETEDVRTAC